MSLRMYNLTVTATAQPLSAALANTTRGGVNDEACRQIILSMDTADCFIGDSTVTTSVYGKKLFVDTASTEQLVFGPFESGPIKLSDLYVVGTSGKLHILTVPS